ncbi:MAG: translational GTPase TypA [Firmicutes bacterium HGW-Firmicutes-1]|jgi:GTP-binding protein|nr:MAG: translational GTPase TypA [Firmicutes bacterium HGW-Firmicutes-1]
MAKKKIINIAVIAHVDAGKSTLVDAFLSQSGVFRENEEVIDCVMDSNDLERERGITIYSKNCSIQYGDYKINIVDTPGHSDFSSEVERIIKTVDTVILLVDSSEGPMPQTRFVLQKSLEHNLRPILFINKIDKKDQRATEVVNMTFDLFVDLDASDEQLDFPVLYGVGRDGIALHELEHENEDLGPLFDTIINHVDPYPDKDEEPLQFQVSALGYDDYIGRLGIGRVYSGTLKEGQQVAISKFDGSVVTAKVSKLYNYAGLKQVPQKEIFSGDIAVISGIPDISIGETICNIDNVIPLPLIQIEEPTLSMNFLVNSSPFAGRSGKFVTSRHLKERLDKELEINVGLKIEELGGVDGFKVSGRGELHLSVLIEYMRREGYEISVSKPEVIMHRDGDTLVEPVERVIVSLPDEYVGAAISSLSMRKGQMEHMESDKGFTKLEYVVPTRGLLGFRTEMITDSRGEATILRTLIGFEPFKGEIPQRNNGVLVSGEQGTSTPYALNSLSERAIMIIPPGTEVYEGMLIGINSRKDDMTVNPCKEKKMTNTRSSGNDDAVKLAPPRTFSLEEALEFIAEDELVEVTPDSVRLRKKMLREADRNRYNKSRA